MEAFNNCESLQSITLPSTLEHISDWAFNGCRNLNEVELNEGIQRIGSRSFQFCTSLQSVNIPSTVSEIGWNAFWGCTNLRDIVIRNERIQIDDKAFSRCTSLERFKFPGLSARLDNIIQAEQRDIEAKMDDIHAVEWRGGELDIPAVSREIENRLWGRKTAVVEIDKEKLGMIVRLIRYYEVKEATTLFELALWKSKINQAEGDCADRGASCLVEVPGPVKDTILQYLR